MRVDLGVNKPWWYLKNGTIIFAHTHAHIHVFITCKTQTCITRHDDVIKWKHFSRYWPFLRGIHRSSVNSPHKGQWCGVVMFSLTCAWINVCVDNGEAGDLRRQPAHYDVTVMRYGVGIWAGGDKPAQAKRKRQTERHKQTETHEDVKQWKRIPRYWTFVRGINRSPVDPSHKGPVTWVLMFSLMLA